MLESSVALVRPRFDRKNFSGKNEKPDNLSVMSSVRLDVAGVVITEDVNDGPIVPIVVVVVAVVIVVVAGGGGIAAVASGRIPIADDASTGTIRAGFFINDKNRC